VLGVIQRGFVNSGPINYDRLILLHQICKIISSKRFNRNVQEYICDKSAIPFRIINECLYFEQLSVEERYYILQLAWWLLGNTSAKLKESVKKKTIKINYLYRDSSEPYLIRKFKSNKNILK
jgi:hypothetical protein